MANRNCRAGGVIFAARDQADRLGEETGMRDIPGYNVVSKVYEGVSSVVYRACRAQDGAPVILKVLRDECRDAHGIARFKTEYEITRAVQGAQVVQAIALEHHNHSLILVLQDSGGESLAALLRRRRFTLSEVLSIGIQIASGLADIHAANVMHKDINPANIVYNTDSGALNIIDFSHSTQLQRETTQNINPNTLEGSLPYMSPEQTGRMNRTLDFRTDYYSFGVTLHELLTHKRPFENTDPLELIHCHIAREPRPLHAVDTGIPLVLSRIVSKLMSKTAEERYQSAWGIVADLQNCLTQLQTNGQVADFELGREDIPDRFHIPEKLYGREQEIDTLLSAFERTARGAKECMLIAGYSGIGKTSLVREIYKPITQTSGFMIAGKFDQFQGAVPFSAVAEAFGKLLRQVMTEEESRLAQWRERLLNALEPHAQVVIDIVPELEHIIGPQPPVPDCGPEEALNRARSTLKSFIRLFCRPEHPLVIFLDDLQWVDPASLKLIEMILAADDIGHLLLIASYRDNEVSAGHPFALTLEELRKDGVVMNALALSPLDLHQVSLLIADAVHSSVAAVEPLARITHTKTRGNPFFIDEFLKSLYANQLLYFDRAARKWCWDLDRIHALSVTDNVVDLVTAKIKRFRSSTRKLLQLAASIGSVFSLVNLRVIAEAPTHYVVNGLYPAIADGLIIPLDSDFRLSAPQGMADGIDESTEFRFAHDRIQQAAYTTVADAERPALHLKIGRLLLKGLPEELIQVRLFDLVNHMNHGVQLIEDAAERARLIDLNLAAGAKARAASAYESAFDYYARAIDMLGMEGWSADYSKTLRAYTAAVDSAYLSKNYARLQALADIALAHSKSVLDEIDINLSQVFAASAQGDLVEATQIGLNTLAKLGTRYPTHPSELRVAAGMLHIKWLTRNQRVNRLHELPPMTDPRRLAEMRILPVIGTTAYWAGYHNLVALLIFRSLEASIKHGYNPVLPFGLSAFAMLLCGVTQEIEAGYNFSQVALEHVQKGNDKAIKVRVYAGTAVFVSHWKQPARDTMKMILEGYRLAVSIGYYEFVGHCAFSYLYNAYHIGQRLPAFVERCRKFSDETLRIGQLTSHHTIAQYRQFALNLMGKAMDATQLVGAAYDEQALLQKHMQSGEGGALANYHYLKSQLCFLFGDYTNALDHARQAEPYKMVMISTSQYVSYCFFKSLSMLALYQDASWSDRIRYRITLLGMRWLFAHWSRHAPVNYRHRCLLLEAEYARVFGNESATLALYDQAIELARRNGYINDEALGNELAAKYHLSQGRTKVAGVYMRDAHDAYEIWGAAEKVRRIRVDYPELLAAAKSWRQMTRLMDSVSVSGSESATVLDIDALKKALKAIAEETVHSRMLTKIISTAIEFSGAQKGVLLLRKDRDTFCIEAQSTVDQEHPVILQSIQLASSDAVSKSVINYVRTTRQGLVIHNAQGTQDPYLILHTDDYIAANRIKSLLCIPILLGGDGVGELLGVLYLENNLATHVFTEDRIGTLEIICLAAAGRLELSRKAATDGLTGLYNHDYFQTMLAQEFSLAARKSRALSVLMIDIDHFKNFNDRYGHQVGDLVVKQVAGVIKGMCRGYDTVARYGGEEIAIILPETDAELALMLGERLRQAVEDLAITHAAQELKITISIGVASLYNAIPDKATLLKEADTALYRSKKSGRNRVTLAA